MIRRESKARDHGEGSFPEEAVRKTTAKISCMIRMPIANCPCVEDMEPLSSNIFTAKTVEEKLGDIWGLLFVGIVVLLTVVLVGKGCFFQG